MNCSEAGKFSHAFVDGELASRDRETYEQHLAECDSCSHGSRLLARFKTTVRDHLPPPEVPESLRVRIETAIETATAPRRRAWPWQAYPRVFPAAVAAAGLLIVFVTARSQRSPMVKQALNMYHAGVPMDVVDSNCTQVANWFRGRLDFTVQPPRLGNQGSCQGGRVVNVADRFGAYMEVQVPRGHRVGMMVFDGDDEPAPGPRHRVVRGRPVNFGSQRGVSLATFRGEDGLNYVVTGDVDEDALSNIVQASFRQ